MRRFCALTLAPVMALAFFFVGTPAANAFGAEVLGCAWWNDPWVANNCGSSVGLVTFSAHNLSGTYSYNWTFTLGGNPITFAPCNGTQSACLNSGCTATSSTCAINDDGAKRDSTLVASLRLTQAGQSRTITATAIVEASSSDCRTC